MPDGQIRLPNGTVIHDDRAGLKPLVINNSALGSILEVDGADHLADIETRFAIGGLNPGVQEAVESQIKNEMSDLPALGRTIESIQTYSSMKDDPKESVAETLDNQIRLSRSLLNRDWGQDYFKTHAAWYSEHITSNEDIARHAVTHEMGHVVSNSMTPEHKNEILTTIFQNHLLSEQVNKRGKDVHSIDTNKMATVLSAYGATNTDEFLAECWAEYRLSKNPRPLAASVGAKMESHIGEAIPEPERWPWGNPYYEVPPANMATLPVSYDWEFYPVEGAAKARHAATSGLARYISRAEIKEFDARAISTSHRARRVLTGMDLKVTRPRGTRAPRAPHVAPSRSDLHLAPGATTVAPPTPEPREIRDGRRALARTRTEAATAAVSAALTSALDDQRQLVLGRLRGRKARQGTRHWVGPAVGTKAIDATYTLPPRGVDDVTQAAGRVLGVTLGSALDGASVTVDPSYTRDPLGVANEIVQGAIAREITRLTGLVGARADELRKVISDADANGDDLDAIIAKVQDFYTKSDAWADQSADVLVNGGVNSGSLDLAKSSGVLLKEWLSSHDDRVRPTHRIADGQIVNIDDPFRSGAFLLDYPGDPSGLPESGPEVYGCRCTMVFPPPIETSNIQSWQTPISEKASDTPGADDDSAGVAQEIEKDIDTVVANIAGHIEFTRDPSKEPLSPAMAAIDDILSGGQLHGELDAFGDALRGTEPDTEGEDTLDSIAYSLSQVPLPTYQAPPSLQGSGGGNKKPSSADRYAQREQSILILSALNDPNAAVDPTQKQAVVMPATATESFWGWCVADPSTVAGNLGSTVTFNADTTLTMLEPLATQAIAAGDDLVQVEIQPGSAVLWAGGPTVDLPAGTAMQIVARTPGMVTLRVASIVDGLVLTEPAGAVEDERAGKPLVRGTAGRSNAG